MEISFQGFKNTMEISLQGFEKVFEKRWTNRVPLGVPICLPMFLVNNTGWFLLLRAGPNQKS